MSGSAVFDGAMDLARAGLRVIPARFEPKPGGAGWNKVPCVKEWEQAATNDLAQVKSWRGLFLRHGGVGIVHAGSDTFAIDPDRHNPERDGLTTLRRLAETNGTIPLSPIVNTPTGGCHFIFRRPRTLVGLKGVRDHGLGPGLDVVYGFSVAPPSTYALGTYEWETPIFEVAPPLPPDWLVELLLAIERDRRLLVREDIPQDGGLNGAAGDLDHVFTPGSRHGALVSLAGTLRKRGLDAEDMLPMLQSYNRRRCHPPKDDAEVQMIAEDVAARYARGSAALNGSAPLGAYSASSPALARLDAAIQGVIEDPGDRPNLLVGWQDLGAAKPIEWIIPDIIPARAYVMVYAAQGMGKTLVMLHWAAEASRDGPVIYAALEGQNGLPGRLAAWRKANGLDPEDLRFYRSPLDLRSAASVAEFAGALIDYAKTIDGPIRMIIVDTLARAIPGADENSAGDSGLVTAAIDRLMRETGATVVIVHHPDKGGRAPRGSSAFLAAVDTIVRVHAKDRLHTVEVEKQKDGGEAGHTADFERHAVGLVDREGQPFTAPAVTPLETAREAAVSRLNLTFNRRVVLEAVSELRRRSEPVTIAAARRIALPDKATSSTKDVFDWAEAVGVLVRLEDKTFDAGPIWPAEMPLP